MSWHKFERIVQKPIMSRPIQRGMRQERRGMPDFSIVRAGKEESYAQALVRLQKHYEPPKLRNGSVPHGLRPEILVIEKTAYGSAENIRSSFPSRRNGLTWKSNLE